MSEVLHAVVKEVAIEEKTKMRDRFFEISMDLLCIAGTDGYFKKVSRSFEQTLGYSEEELLNTPFSEFVVSEETPELKTFDFFRSGHANFDYETRHRCKDGTIKWLAWRSVFDMNDGLIYAVGRDITHEKNKEKYEYGEAECLKALIRANNDIFRHACMVQDALKLDHEQLKKIFPESFIYYAPMEMISGDFIWMAEVGELVMVAVADTTGERSSGAMMSMICSWALNRVVQQYRITDPGKVLDRARALMIEVFSKSNQRKNDGMNISLCAINRNKREIKWSGASRPVFYTYDGVIHEIEANDQSVAYQTNPVPFLTHTIKMPVPTCIYLFTDGYSKQTGGVKNKKFMHNHFKQRLSQTFPMGMNSQKFHIQKSFENWKGQNPQTDDVLVVGLRV